MRILLVTLLSLSACSSNTAPPADMTMLPDLTPPPTDKQLCDAVCAKFVGCNVTYGNACSAGCQGSSVFLPCVRASADDCNAYAICAFKQFSNDFCGNVGGVPAGSGTCNAAAACEGNCNLAGAGVSCACGCIAAASPSKALPLLINNQCAINKCAFQCSPAGSGTACNTCAAMMCPAERASCDSQ